MAIVNSLAIGKSVKSAGNLTYKVVRGRTIASQRITTNKSNTHLQEIQRDKFGMVSKSMLLCRNYIETCYEKSKYGSIRNSFYRQNPNFTLGGKVTEILEGLRTLTDGFMQSLERPENGIRQLHFLSSGSLPCLVSMDIEETPSVEVAGNTYTNVRTINGSTIFSFMSPFKLSEVTMIGVAFVDGILHVSEAVGNEMGQYRFNGAINGAIGGFTVNAVLDGELVTSISVSDGTPTTTPSAELFFFVPSVNGKVPNTSAVYIPQSGS